MVHAKLRVALAAALFLCFTGGAVAQVAPIDPAVAITLPPDALDVGAGNQTTLTATVSNPGSFAGTVSLSIAAVDGWTFAAEPAGGFPLASGASQDVTITVIAPAAGVGAASGSLAVTATLTDQAGRTATADASAPLARVDPPPPPVPPPPYGLWAAAAVAALLVVAGVVALQVRENRRKRERAEAQRRAAEEAKRLAEAEAARLAAEKAAREAAERAAYFARETGITIGLHDGPRPFGTSRELAYRLVVRNVSDRPRVGVVGIAEIPAGWRASVALPKLPLSPGESALVAAYVKPDVSVPAGSKSRIVFRAKPEEAQELDEKLALDVEAPLPHVPTMAEADRPRSSAREPVAQRPALRK